MLDAKYWIDRLGLKKHPEGGFFAETYRSNDKISAECLNKNYNSERNVSTAIYFLITKDNPSKFHRLKSDEIWYYHYGGSIEIHIIDENFNLISKKLGVNQNEEPQQVIPKNNWFAAEISYGDYVLISCSVAPGFDFADFELADKENLLNTFIFHKDIINKLT